MVLNEISSILKKKHCLGCFPSVNDFIVFKSANVSFLKLEDNLQDGKALGVSFSLLYLIKKHPPPNTPSKDPSVFIGIYSTGFLCFQSSLTLRLSFVFRTGNLFIP